MLSKISWRSLLPSCSRPSSSSSSSSFSCFGRRSKRVRITKQASLQSRLSFLDVSNSGSPLSLEDLSLSLVGSNLHVFTLAELRAISRNFSSSNFLGEGGFGPVHKGFVDDKFRPGLKAQPVAVKLLDLEGSQGHREWLAEVIFLGQLRHPHLVKLIGYCCEDEHRLLVYEYMSKGSLENHLFNRFSASLPWSVRLKIADGAAKGLAFLHETEKPVIYRDFKASNILLDSTYTAKLSDFGLAKDGPEGDNTHVSTRIMGTQGYAAPEYIMTGHLTAMSDVYSFGVVLLELLTGRRSVDKSRQGREQNLVDWARPMLKDANKLNLIMDPHLEGQYSPKAAQKAAALAYQCLSHHPKSRPTMSAAVKTLEPLLDLLDDMPIGPGPFTHAGRPEDGKLGDANLRLPLEEEAACHHRQHRGQRHRVHLPTIATANGKKGPLRKTPTRYHHHHHGQRHRSHSPSILSALTSYSDTALYTKYGKVV